jgi:maltose/moltooligosaccharide transporter
MPRALAEFSPAERRFTLLFFPVAFGFGARMALIVFDGPLARRFTESGYLIGLLLAIGPLIATIANPVFGRLSDRTWTRGGRRIPYALVGIPLSTLIFFAIPSAPTFGVLLALFALRALLLSVGGAPLMSLVPDLIAPARRGRAMALFMLAGGISAVAIQVLGKAVWDRNFALVFYATGCISLVFAVPPLFFIREPRLHAAEPISSGAAGALLSRAFAQLLSYGRPIALFLSSASLRALGAGMVIGYFTLFAATDLGISVGDAALAVAVGGVMRLLLALPAGRLVDAHDRKRLLLFAAVGGAAVHLCTGLFVRHLWQLYLAVGAGTVVGVLDMTAGGPLFMDLLPESRRGELIGVNMVLMNIFQSAGALLGGVVFAWTGGYRTIYPLAALCFAVSAAVLARVKVPARTTEPGVETVPTLEAR